MNGQTSFFDDEPPDEPPGRIRLRRNPNYDDGLTIAEARLRLADEIEERVKQNCPCCGKPALPAKRSIHTSQAVGLIRINRAGGAHDYVDTAEITRNDARADVAKSHWWDLITEMPHSRRADGGRAGWWKLTDLGRAFVMRETSVTKYAHIFNNEVQWRSGPPVSIVDCLHNQFDWHELMYG